jgi:hypothetical protein
LKSYSNIDHLDTDLFKGTSINRIQWEDIRLGRVIGKGATGLVHHAVWIYTNEKFDFYFMIPESDHSVISVITIITESDHSVINVIKSIKEVRRKREKWR